MVNPGIPSQCIRCSLKGIYSKLFFGASVKTKIFFGAGEELRIVLT
jgi:hypothetical protein